MPLKTILLASILLTACTGAPQIAPQNEVQSSSAAASVQPNCSTGSSIQTKYKRFGIGGISVEIPTTWSTVYMGDVAPMTLPADNTFWIPFDSIRFSIAKESVQFGDMNWSQIDIAEMNPSVMQQWIERMQTDTSDHRRFEYWEKKTIAGTSVSVAHEPINTDGSVDKGSPGGTYYFFTKIGWILQKQAKSDEAFEKDFLHMLRSARINPSTYFGPLNDQIHF